jgi:tape measure domain-containing protein
MGGAAAGVAGSAQTLQNVGTSAQAAASGMDKASASAGSLWGQLAALGKMFVGAMGLSGLGEVVRMSDEYGQMASRIRMATDSAEEFEAVQARLAETASNTYRPLSEAQEMFIRSSDALKSMGYNTQGVLDVTDSLSYLMVTNAASSERAANAINAFSKSLQTGKVDAESWRSIIAAVPSVVEDIAAATGLAEEEIRRMGAEGILALDALTEGLRKAREKNQQLAADMPTTVGDAFTTLKNNLQVYVGTLNAAEGYTAKFVKAIEFLGKNVHVLVTAGLTALVGALIAVGARGLAAAGAFAKTQIATARNAIAQRDLAQAALQAARAEMAAANAALAHERAAVGLGTAITGVAAAEARQAAAATALAAAERGAAAAKGGLAAALGVAGRFLTGPWGIALATGISLLGVFKKDTEAAKESQLDFSKSLEETAKQFAALSRAQQGAEIARAENAKKAAEEAREQAAEELRKLAKDESSWFRGKFDETEIAIDTLASAASAAKSGSVDFDRMAAAIDRIGSASKETRNAMREKLGELEKLHGEALNAAAALKTLNDAQASQAKPSGEPVENLQKSLEKAREAASALGVDLAAFSSKASPEFEQLAKDLDALSSRFDKLSEAGYDMGGVIEDAIGKALAKTKNPADLNLLIDKVKNLGEEGKIAKPKMVDLFEAIKTKAREAGGEAQGLRNEIAELERQANAIRSGKSGQGKKIKDLETAQMSPEAQERQAIREAEEAAREARFYASASGVAQMDGRGEEALKYAEMAKEAYKEADEAAGRISDKAAQKRAREDLMGAELGINKAEQAEAEARLKEMESARENQEAQIEALETRVDDLKARIEAIPANTEKTITVNTVYKGAPPVEGGTPGGWTPGFAPGGWTGDIATDRIAGVVHGKEFVNRAAVVAQPGARRFLELFNRIGMAALPVWLKTIKIPGYQTGGYVAPTNGVAGGGEMLPAVFNFPGVGKVPAQVTQSVADELARTLKIEALMHGRR